MFSQVNLLLSLLPALVIAQGYETYLGSCPSHKGMDNFDTEEFLKHWFVVYQTNASDPCLTYLLTKKSEGKLIAHQKSHSSPANMVYDNELILTYRNFDATHMTMDTDTLLSLPSDVTILLTDYVSYAVVYICQNRLALYHETIEIWSRDRTIDSKTLDDIKTDLANEHLNWTTLNAVNHALCPSIVAA